MTLRSEPRPGSVAVPGPDAFFFNGATGRRLGVLHAAAGSARTGVVSCYPLGEEHLQAHRTYVQLSLLLAERGFPSLRFDYGGCGDSDGELETARLSGWLDDIVAAVSELRARTGVKEVVLAGVRLGASLALRASRLLSDASGVVLWEPLGSGGTYFERSLSEYQRWLVGSFAVPMQAPEGIVDLRGFPIGKSMIEDLASLDDFDFRADALRIGALRRALVLGATPSALALALKRHGTEVAVFETTDALPWDKAQSSGQGLATVRCLRRIVTWMEASFG